MASKTLFTSLVFALSACAAEGNLSPVAKTLDSQLSSVEREVVSLAEAMPADKFNFAPKDGEFKGVRNFGQQAKHIAAVNFEVAAAILDETSPEKVGTDENGPDGLTSKTEIVNYLKRSFAYTHRALASITAENLMALGPNAFGKNKVPRLNMATVPESHSFDHYGQMVVYARMCGIVPPASRK